MLVRNEVRIVLRELLVADKARVMVLCWLRLENSGGRRLFQLTENLLAEFSRQVSRVLLCVGLQDKTVLCLRAPRCLVGQGFQVVHAASRGARSRGHPWSVRTRASPALP